VTVDAKPANQPPVRIVKTSPEENVIRRDLLRHALDEGSFAKYIVENFSRSDFPAAGDIFDALRRSVMQTGAVDRNIIGEAVGWDAFYEFERRLPEIVRTGDHWDVATAEWKKQIRLAAMNAVRDGDNVRALALVTRLGTVVSAPAVVTPEGTGRITEANIESFVVDMAANEKRDLLGYGTGLSRLDSMTLGLVPGEAWAISAPTSGGKTQIVSMILNEVIRQGGVGLYISAEMSVRGITARLVGANIGLNPRKIIMGREPRSVSALPHQSPHPIRPGPYSLPPSDISSPEHISALQ
jgi:hypothetical protein